MKEEVWLPVPNHDGYEVSSFGRVRSYLISNSSRRRAVPKILKASLTHGYPCVQLKGSLVRRQVHLYVLEAFVGSKPAWADSARHLDGNRTNNRVENLAWGTHEEQWRDKDRHGTLLKGEECASAKLSDEDVHKIREELASGHPIKEVCVRYAVSYGTILDIVHLRTWTHLPSTPPKRSLRALGEKNHNAVLTADNVRSIKTRLLHGASRAVLAREFGVSNNCIRRIATGKTWRHIHV